MPRLSQDPKNLAAIAATRQRLLDAACDEFLQVAYFETDTNKIARRAGLSPGTFYNHFQNKIDIFAAAFERLLNEETSHLAQICAARAQQGVGLDEVAEVFAETLIESRKRLVLLRLQGEILLRSEPKVFESLLAVRRHKIEVIRNYARESGMTLVSLDAIHVHLHIINSLADAIAGNEFRQHGASDRQARREIVLQVLRCFEREGGAAAASAVSI